MEETSERTGPRAAHAEPPGELARRLLRRLTEPAGLVDVRYAQQKYERFTEWLDERWALLRRIQARYADDSADDQQPLVLRQELGEQVNLYSTAVQSPPTAEQHLPSAEQRAAPGGVRDRSFAPARPVEDSPPAAAGEFRVSRRRAPFDPHSGPTALMPARPPLDGVRSVGDDSGGSGQRATAPETAPVAPPGSPPGSVLPPTKPQPTPELPPRRERATPSGRQPTAPDSAREPELKAGLDRSRAGRRGMAGEVAQAAQAVVSSPPPGSRASGTGREPLVAAELTQRLLTRAEPEMVWRESPGGPAAAAAASHGRVGGPARDAPQTDSSSNGTRPEPAGRRSAPAKAQGQRGEGGIEQLSPQAVRAISEKVMRAISLDLAVELERRGLKKWR